MKTFKSTLLLLGALGVSACEASPVGSRNDPPPSGPGPTPRPKPRPPEPVPALAEIDGGDVTFRAIGFTPIETSPAIRRPEGAFQDRLCPQLRNVHRTQFPASTLTQVEAPTVQGTKIFDRSGFESTVRTSAWELSDFVIETVVKAPPEADPEHEDEENEDGMGVGIEPPETIPEQRLRPLPVTHRIRCVYPSAWHIEGLEIEAVPYGDIASLRKCRQNSVFSPESCADETISLHGIFGRLKEDFIGMEPSRDLRLNWGLRAATTERMPLAELRRAAGLPPDAYVTYASVARVVPSGATDRVAAIAFYNVPVGGSSDLLSRRWLLTEHSGFGASFGGVSLPFLERAMAESLPDDALERAIAFDRAFAARSVSTMRTWSAAKRKLEVPSHGLPGAHLSGGIAYEALRIGYEKTASLRIDIIWRPHAEARPVLATFAVEASGPRLIASRELRGSLLLFGLPQDLFQR